MLMTQNSEESNGNYDQRCCKDNTREPTRAFGLSLGKQVSGTYISHYTRSEAIQYGESFITWHRQ